MRHNDTSRWLLAPATAVLLALAACGGGDEESVILPTATSFCVTPPATDPVVFLQKNPADTTDTDNVVLVDVMLRPGAGATFSALSLEMTFTPGVLQVGQIDASATPLGDCTSSDPCAPLCANNVSPTDPMTPGANDTGDLILGVAAKSNCPTATVNGTDRLLTISFIGASVGTSTLTLVDGAGRGDCEILDANVAPLPIACDAGMCGLDEATITVTR